MIHPQCCWPRAPPGKSGPDGGICSPLCSLCDIVLIELCQMPSSECSLNEFSLQENLDARSVSSHRL